jgi:hypothetical protein
VYTDSEAIMSLQGHEDSTEYMQVLSVITRWTVGSSSIIKLVQHGVNLLLLTQRIVSILRLQESGHPLCIISTPLPTCLPLLLQRCAIPFAMNDATCPAKLFSVQI